ncbi:14 kDa phosphohistidine phosphatase [Amyelois transitella]|uniref:14 kDa phosphohistidine phosphatase n=1 Tax=Amyelois transitella TaxID=680683 RepID=UPI0029903E15|nr:14 kDa phosphohistidine phosphatase [Amyelois transitella]
MSAISKALSVAKNKCACLAKQLTFAKASNPSSRNMSCVCPALAAIPKVDIDPEGVFKYILLRVHEKGKEDDEVFVTIVRGYRRCNYHSDIYEEVQTKLEPLDCEPMGGGRISHDPDHKKIHIYGYSQGYGKADHEITAKLVKEAYPGYYITISDEGY